MLSALTLSSLILAWTCAKDTSATDISAQDASAEDFSAYSSSEYIEYDDRRPRISFITPHQEIEIGDAVTVECVVRFTGAVPKVQWYRVTGEGTVQPLVEDGRIDRQFRESATFEAAVTDGRLRESIRISRAQAEDQGMYHCQVNFNATVSFSRHSLLTVLTPSTPSKPGRLGPVTARFLVVKRGMDVVLECHDAQNDWVTWRKHGDPTLLGTGRNLRLMRVERWDSGLYYCSTNTTKHNITLQVDNSPNVTAPDKVVRQAIGHEAILKCKVSALPVPRISWFRISSTSASSESLLIESGFKHRVMIDSFKDGFIQTSLHVKNINSEDIGEYECVAENDLGLDRVRMALEKSETFVDASAAATTEQISLVLLVELVGAALLLLC